MAIESFLPLITGALGGAVSAGVFKGPVQSLEDWWYINYGKDLSEQAALIRTKQEINVERLKNSTLANVSEIKPEDIQEPKIKILGPALEASRYYIEEDDIRDMFAKLISSSMDKSKNSINHPAFVEILKQMTSLDAENIFCIFNNDDKRSMIINLKNTFNDGSFSILVKNIFLDNPNQKNQDLLGASLVNLERLGLVKSTFDRHNSPIESYDSFKNSDLFKYWSDAVDSRNETIQRQIDFSDENQHLSESLTKIEMDYGLIELTYLGKNFCEICL